MSTDLTIPYDRRVVQSLYFSIRSTARKSVKRSSTQRTTHLSPKAYQNLLICLRGLKIDVRRISATLAYYHHLFLSTESTIKNYDDNILSKQEIRLFLEALPDMVLKADQAKDPLDIKLAEIQSYFPFLKRDLLLIDYRLNTEARIQQLARTIAQCYRFVFAFNEAYATNLAPILHTIRSIGNQLNHGSYLGGARGCHLGSLSILSTHYSIDRTECLMSRLKTIIEDSDIDFSPLRRLYSELIDPAIIGELRSELKKSLRTEGFGLVYNYLTEDRSEALLKENLKDFDARLEDMLKDRLQYIMDCIRKIEASLVTYDYWALRNFIQQLFDLPDLSNERSDEVVSLRFILFLDQSSMSNTHMKNHELPGQTDQGTRTPSSADSLESKPSCGSVATACPSFSSCCSGCEFESMYTFLKETGVIKRRHAGASLKAVVVWVQSVILAVVLRFSNPIALTPEDLADWASCFSSSPRSAQRENVLPPKSCYIAPTQQHARVQFDDLIITHCHNHENGNVSGASGMSSVSNESLICRSAMAREMRITRGGSRFTVGCCAMPVKLQSVPMKTIFRTLQEVGNFELIEITGSDLLEKEASEWPIVDCLIAFYSKGYPLSKVSEYVRRVRPVVLNDVDMQYVLRDRGRVYERLAGAGIPVARNFVVNHLVEEIEEHEDYIVFKGEKIAKPFIEKPINADDHNNYVYYPSNAGGGCKKLFRKLANRSSEYYPDICRIRRDGTYVYEEFLPTLGTDIKVYTVGPMYAHAEARKSPTLDGRVQRTENGKEERYPVLLTNDEKWIAYMIVEVFKQTVCGFDILRTTSGKAVVCDVNGWSFVKGNPKYYSDCANLISSMFLHALRNRRSGLRPAIHQLRTFSHSNMLLPEQQARRQELLRQDTPHMPSSAISSATVKDLLEQDLPMKTGILSHFACLPDPRSQENLRRLNRSSCILDEITREDLITLGMPVNWANNEDDEEDGSEGLHTAQHPSPATDPEELQTIVVVMRHGDRSPKQKMKFLSKSKMVLEFFKNRQTNSRNRAVKLKSKQDLLQFQQLAIDIQNVERENLTEEERISFQRVESLLNTEDLEITRKVQLVMPKYTLPDSPEGTEGDAVMIVLKWGGDLTSKGLKTSEALGHHLRESLYPGEKDGLLRLHSTFRHDFKMYTSDEGRCQLTAAAFTKGFLDLDGDLTPILIQMVCRDERGQELFLEGEYTQTVRSCKQIIQEMVNTDLAHEHVCQQFFQPRFSFVRCPLCYPEDAFTLSSDLEEVNEPLARKFTADDKLVFSPSGTSFNASLTHGSSSWMALHTLDQTVNDDAPASVSLSPVAVAVWQSLLKEYHTTLQKIGSFRQRLLKVNSAIESLIRMIEHCLEDVAELPEDVMSPELRRTQKRLTSIKTRWTLLRNSWYKNGVFDGTKIPEVYDNARFDMLHSHTFLHYANAHSVIYDVFNLTEALGPFVSALEFGITPDDRVEIGKKTVPGLLKKIYDDILYQYARQNVADNSGGTESSSDLGQLMEEEHIILRKAEARRMGIKSPWRKVRSRYYAASASHVMSLLNVLTYGQFISQSSYHYRHSSDNTTTSAIGSLDLALIMPANSLTMPVCPNIPPLSITAGDAPYLSHISIRVWRPASSLAKNASLGEYSVELCWNAESVKSSIRCSAADLANVLKHGFSKKLALSSPQLGGGKGPC